MGMATTRAALRCGRASVAEVAAQELFGEFLGYQRMLAGFYARRNAAQFQFAGSGGAAAGAAPAPQGAVTNPLTIAPDITFRDSLDLDVGRVKLQLLHTPGETPDHLTVWVPSSRPRWWATIFTSCS